jgi:hypothetical protein
VGDAEALGGWQLEAAPVMAWSEGDDWRVAVALPVGAPVEYKFAIKDPHGWAPGGRADAVTERPGFHALAATLGEGRQTQMRCVGWSIEPPSAAWTPRFCAHLPPNACTAQHSPPHPPLTPHPHPKPPSAARLCGRSAATAAGRRTGAARCCPAAGTAWM